MTLSLAVTERGAEKADAVRARGEVPAVVYGHKQEPISIAVNAGELQRLWRTAGQTSVVTLTGVGAAKDTLVRDVQFHPVSGDILHVDFYALEKGKKVAVTVPLSFVGTSPAEKAGSVLVKALHEIEIDVDPTELPHELEVDVSSIAADGDHITVGQIKLPKSAELMTDAEEVVVSAVAQEEEPAEVTPAAEGEGETTPAETPQEE
jgi:large subunit ribosomal protein L25